MTGWFSFLFFFVFVFVFSFFALSLITVPQEQQWLTCKVLCLNGKCKTVLQKYKCSVSRACSSGPPGPSKLMAQLGSNPFKPLLRATADTATPSEGSESGSILARKPLHFPSPSPNTRDRAIPQQTDQDPPASSHFPQSFWLGLWFQSARSTNYSGNMQAQYF